MIRSVQRQVVVVRNVVSSRRCLASSSEGGEAPLQNRRLWRWGAGQGGIMGQVEAPEISKDPTCFSDDFTRGVSSAACGSSHSAFVVNGQLYTYGSSKYGQLGQSSSSSSTDVPGLVDVDEAARVEQVSLGAFHSACVTADGSLYTWGWGGSFLSGAGALGHGSNESFSEPVLVQSLQESGHKVRQVACGSQHTLALTTDGLLFATGKGDFGRLGRGDTSDEPSFQEIDYFQQTNDSVLRPGEPAVIKKIGAGNNFSAVMSEQGELWVWGRNDYGQLGLGEEAMGDLYSAERFPRIVRSLPADGHRIVDFCCGEYHIVVVTEAGNIFEWGNRSWLEPHLVSLPSLGAEDLKDIVKVSAGEKFSFLLTRSGTVFVWGSKNSGCLALGTECASNVVEPTLIPSERFGHQKVVDIVASKYRCLAITDEGEFVA